MTIKSSLLFAFRLLLPRIEKKSPARRSLTGALLCIAISLVPLVVVLTVSNGMIQGITDRIIGLSSSHLEVILYPDAAASAVELTQIARRFVNEKDIVSSYAELQGMGLAAGTHGRTGAVVRAVDSGIFRTNTAYHTLFTVIGGTADLSAGGHTAVIGEKIAESLGIGPGDSFRLITTKQSPGGIVIPRITVFKVAGVVSCGYQELDAVWVFIPLETGYSILPSESSTASIKLETPHAFSSELVRIQESARKKIGQLGNVYRWDELNADEYENFASTRMMLMFIMLLIVLVASVNVFSALVMLSMERRREIAILKSLGGTQGGISLSFLITGLIIGAGGAVTGIPCGLFFAVNVNKIISFTEKAVNLGAKFVYLLKGHPAAGFVKIHLLDPAYYLQTVPVSVPFRELFVIGTGTLLLSLIASAVPAFRAGAEKPLETLRKI